MKEDWIGKLSTRVITTQKDTPRMTVDSFFCGVCFSEPSNLMPHRKLEIIRAKYIMMGGKMLHQTDH